MAQRSEIANHPQRILKSFFREETFLLYYRFQSVLGAIMKRFALTVAGFALFTVSLYGQSTTSPSGSDGGAHLKRVMQDDRAERRERQADRKRDRQEEKRDRQEEKRERKHHRRHKKHHRQI